MTDYNRLYQKYKYKYHYLRDQRAGTNNNVTTKPSNIFKINEDEAIDEIYFWGSQFTEHPLFLAVGLSPDTTLEKLIRDVNNSEPNDNTKLKSDETVVKAKQEVVVKKLQKRGEDLHTEWVKFLEKIFDPKTIPLKGISLTQEQINSVKEKTNYQVNLKDVFTHIRNLKKYKEDIRVLLEDDKEWIGWVFVSMVKHMLRELKFLEDKLNDNISESQEIEFCNFHAEDIGASGHLIDPDPKNDADINKASRLFHLMFKIQKKAQLSETEKEEFQMHTHNIQQFNEPAQFLLLSKLFVERLNAFTQESENKIINGEADTIIHPTLIKHVNRESKRALYVLGKIEEKNKTKNETE